MRKPRWIDPRALILLHGESLAEHGGLPGLRDEGALAAALARPQHLYAYRRRADLARLASAYAFGLVRSHPFHDGNKRAGLLTIGLFLGLNGYELAAEPTDTVQTIMELAAGNLTERALAVWLRNHMKRER